MAADLIDKVPDEIDIEAVIYSKIDDDSALNTVLIQEIERYNVLLVTVCTSLDALRKGIKGLVVMSADLDEMFRCLLDGRVPPSWLEAYPSLKPLGSWMRDLIVRIAQLRDWGDKVSHLTHKTM